MKRDRDSTPPAAIAAALRERARRYRSPLRRRPTRIEPAGPGQESVWDYPRPPRVEADPRRVRIEHDGIVLVDSVRALRVLETAGPPCFYLPPDDVSGELLPSGRSSVCEWKGGASYWHVRVGGGLIEDAAWSYPAPRPGYEAIAGHLAFYAGKFDACWVGEARVQPQPGRFYGGWITPELVGPFKGEPGSESW